MGASGSDHKVTGIVVGIDASRNRSGGAKARLAGVLTHGDPLRHGIDEVHLWAHRGLLDELPDAPWLTKHNPSALERSLPSEVLWQLASLPTALRRTRCDVLLSMDAGSVSRFQPAVVISQDMLSFEPGEMARYAYSKAYWRLVLLKYVQMSSLRRAAGAVFLTTYAADVMQRHTGRLSNVRIIPHGIADSFREIPQRGGRGDETNCLYVSNVELYKHQWQVVRAVAKLRAEGFPLVLTLVGRKAGRAGQLLDRSIAEEGGAGFVVLVDELPHSSIGGCLAKADLFVFASSCENMPNTLIEAMAGGLPIACSNRGPMPEVLQDGGTYFDPEAPDSIAAAIRALLTDRELARASAERAKALAGRYSWSRCADETWSFVAQVASKRAGKPFAQVRTDAR
jgi:glycosyltransferase involved in cell wall biosynthesis